MHVKVCYSKKKGRSDVRYINLCQLGGYKISYKVFFFDAAGRWRCGLCGREVPRPRGSRDLSLSKVDWEDSGGDM